MDLKLSDLNERQNGISQSAKRDRYSDFKQTISIPSEIKSLSVPYLQVSEGGDLKAVASLIINASEIGSFSARTINNRNPECNGMNCVQE